MDKIFDTHSHLTLSENHIEVHDHLKECQEVQVRYILDPGIDPFDFKEREEKLKAYSQVFLGVAIAPHISNRTNLSHLNKLKEILKSGKATAISEIGLEYFHLKDNHTYQKNLFADQLELAKEFNLPVFLHIRDAMDDAIEIVKAAGVKRGAVHCFSGDKQAAKRFLNLGFHLSFSGIVTFKNAKNIQEAAQYTPLDRILTETDSPYLAPVPHRGKPNKSPYIIHTHAFLAKLKSIDLQTFNQAVWLNALNILNLNHLDRDHS